MGELIAGPRNLEHFAGFDSPFGNICRSRFFVFFCFSAAHETVNSIFFESISCFFCFFFFLQPMRIKIHFFRIHFLHFLFSGFVFLFFSTAHESKNPFFSNPSLAFFVFVFFCFFLSGEEEPVFVGEVALAGRRGLRREVADAQEGGAVRRHRGNAAACCVVLRLR